MNDHKIKRVEQVKEFLQGTEGICFTNESREKCYAWIKSVLLRLRYRGLKRVEKGLVRRYLEKISGYSRSQIDRLIDDYVRTGNIRCRYHAPVKGFNARYTREDIELLAKIDEWHNTLSGPATKKIFERAFSVFGEANYERLSCISVSHLYNLRKSIPYHKHRRVFDKTRPQVTAIGERRKPIPDNKPGYVRIDTVHQGDQDRVKGLYHINAVDEVTQFEVVCSVEKISERYLIPILEVLLETFPFTLIGFHSDNGSEYINQYVVRLLNKLLIELTKSRSRQSNDNALVECKNGAIVRKHLGYSHIPNRHAVLVNEFTLHVLTPYINFHRPCFFAKTVIDSKGKQKKTYPYKNMMTPYEKLKSLPLPPHQTSFLKENITFEQLDKQAYAMSDNEAARRMSEARASLFRTIEKREKRAA